MVADALREAGHTVVEAENGRKGIEAFNEQEFDCVIADLVMPEVDGLRLVHYIRGFDRQLPVVIVSADVQESTFALCRKLGSTDFLNKPIRMPQLREVVDRALLRARGDLPCA